MKRKSAKLESSLRLTEVAWIPFVLKVRESYQCFSQSEKPRASVPEICISFRGET